MTLGSTPRSRGRTGITSSTSPLRPRTSWQRSRLSETARRDGRTCPPSRCTPMTPRSAPMNRRRGIPAARPGDEYEYGPQKAAAEDAVTMLGDRAFIVRPGLIVGDGDPSDRFGYWAAAFSRRGGARAAASAREAQCAGDRRRRRDRLHRRRHAERGGQRDRGRASPRRTAADRARGGRAHRGDGGRRRGVAASTWRRALGRSALASAVASLPRCPAS